MLVTKLALFALLRAHTSPLYFCIIKSLRRIPIKRENIYAAADILRAFMHHLPGLASCCFVPTQRHTHIIKLVVQCSHRNFLSHSNTFDEQIYKILYTVSNFHPSFLEILAFRTACIQKGDALASVHTHTEYLPGV